MTKENEAFHRMWVENEPEDGVLCAPAGLPVRNKARPRDMLHDQDQTLTPPPEDQPRPYAEVENLPGDPDQDDEEQREEGGLGGANPDNGDALATPNLSREGVKHPVDPEMIQLPTLNVTLWRAAHDDSFGGDGGSFSTSREDAEAYHNNPGFGGPNLYRADVKIHPKKLLDLYDLDDDQAKKKIRQVTGLPHPGAIGADEWIPRITHHLSDAGVEWVRHKESYPHDSETYTYTGGGDDPEMEEVPKTNVETIQLPTLNVDGGREFKTYKVVDGDIKQE